MADPLAVLLMRRFDSLYQQRQVWESHWQEIADFVVPRKADVTKKRTDGDKRTELIFDSTAILASELLAASLHGMLTNASTRWFSLRYRDRNLINNDAAKEWLESVEDDMYMAFARSNFQEQIHELYHDLICFGTGVMFIESDPDLQVNFQTRHCRESFLSEDNKGRVDTVYREFHLPARAFIMQFGADNVDSSIVKKAETNPYEKIRCIHAVYPRDERDPVKVGSKNKPFASVYIDPKNKRILSESGFDEMPYVAPRYLKASFEIGYGRSPAMSCLSDIKMINKMSEVTIRAAQKQVDPPLLVPDDGFMLPIRTVPGGLNFYRSGTRDRIEPLNIGANNPLGLNMEEQRRQAIRSAFYVDQLIMAQGPQMTATEVVQRTEEKMRLLGPVLGRLQAELLQPLISRVYNIMVRQKAFAPAPDFMQDLDLEIEYVSPLAKAQKSGDVQSALRMLELFGPLAQLDQSALDYIDVDGMSKYLLRMLSVPATTVRGEEQVAQIRQERAEQQQQMAEQQEAIQAAEAAGAAAPMIRAANNL
ncbi:head-tail connector protein [uncultured Mediterranean phage uvMED]|nr:head-tail connector protein [uncultured Mediterranean phage uvMED]